MVVDVSFYLSNMKYEIDYKEMPDGLPSVPLGVWLILDHSEACVITDGRVVGEIVKFLPATWWAMALAVVIYAQAAYIRKKNEDSGSRGVKLLYHFAVGVIVDIKRRGRGSSPCPAGLMDASVEGEAAALSLPLVEPTKEQLESLYYDTAGYVD